MIREEQVLSHHSPLITYHLSFMLPEIAHRCESCGAAIRVHAVYCPQCGVPLKGEEQASESERVETPDLKTQALGDELKTVNAASETAAAEAAPVAVAKTDAGETNAEESAVSDRGSDAGAERRRHGVTAAARERVQENLRPRVEKLKQTSAVMLDEAAEDPSLRFVLVAALLIIISLVLLLLSLVR